MIIRVEIDYCTKQNQKADLSNRNTASFVSVKTWNLSIIEIIFRFGTMNIVIKCDTSRLMTALKLVCAKYCANCWVLTK
jgi:hypothetical protein